ncbi:hypothetical protein FVE67_00125 [Thermosulfurimonas marina]|uniref:Segregation and condensation protein A n=1 Tax=Thermosulfurimonas marina TaxID=2047767 RepID=A0A6H1WQ56_9BACT|nr:hypothetical protein [Thermosulfurimonas marina]QJA05289.1 hypothetical protein FVE67_00125 [Thermosulfurimonas marina]
MPAAEPSRLLELWERARRHPPQVLESDLALLTRTYLIHLDALLEKGLERAGEYLQVASYLVYLKSRLLLPRPEKETAPEEEGPSRIQFSSTLPGILPEVLDGLTVLGKDVFVAPGLFPERGELSLEMEELVRALLQVLERAHPPMTEIPRLESLFQRLLEETLRYLENREKFLLQEFLENYQDKLEKLAAILVVLELSFRKICRIFQNSPFSEIEIVARTEEF